MVQTWHNLLRLYNKTWCKPWDCLLRHYNKSWCKLDIVCNVISINLLTNLDTVFYGIAIQFRTDFDTVCYGITIQLATDIDTVCYVITKKLVQSLTVCYVITTKLVTYFDTVCYEITTKLGIDIHTDETTLFRHYNNMWCKFWHCYVITTTCGANFDTVCYVITTTCSGNFDTYNKTWCVITIKLRTNSDTVCYAITIKLLQILTLSVTSLQQVSTIIKDLEQSNGFNTLNDNAKLARIMNITINTLVTKSNNNDTTHLRTLSIENSSEWYKCTFTNINQR